MLNPVETVFCTKVNRALILRNFFSWALEMFAYDDLYSDNNSGIEDARIVSISPLFNDKTRFWNWNLRLVSKVSQIFKIFSIIKDTLEFNLGPDKRFLKLSETRVKFTVEIPANYLFDNDVFAKLVEHTEIVISYESITRKSSQLDNSVTSSVLNKVSYDDSLLNTSLKTYGIFEAK